MNAFHALLGAAVLIANGGAAVDGLILRRAEERFWRLSGAGLAALALQLATGFFVLTSTSSELGFAHFLLPAGALAAILYARSRTGDNRLRLAALAALVAFVASGVAFATGLSAGEGSEAAHADHAHLVDAAYRFADSPEAMPMGQVPCYCGCGAMGHENLRDCFRDDHAVNCNVCLDEAHDVERMVAKGRTVGEIRQAIDRAYGDKGPPTPTRWED